eukprot:c6598_g1_i1.p1 GENE.c6598_g1_i1~~c6598_g1_i1.p1  ORF type:complete len:652 (+),score=177.87 c6598_g1_i1:100-2055(+)
MSSFSVKYVYLYHHDAKPDDVTSGGTRVDLPQSLQDLYDMASVLFNMEVKWIAKPNGDMLTTLHGMPIGSHLFACTSRHRPYTPIPSAKFIPVNRAPSPSPEEPPPTNTADSTERKAFLESLIKKKNDDSQQARPRSLSVGRPAQEVVVVKPARVVPTPITPRGGDKTRVIPTVTVASTTPRSRTPPKHLPDSYSSSSATTESGPSDFISAKELMSLLNSALEALQGSGSSDVVQRIGAAITRQVAPEGSSIAARQLEESRAAVKLLTRNLMAAEEKIKVLESNRGEVRPASEPASVAIRQLQRENDRLQNELKVLQDKLSVPSDSDSSEVSALKQALQDANKALEQLKSGSGDAGSRALQDALASAQIDLETATEERNNYKRLNEDTQLRYDKMKQSLESQARNAISESVDAKNKLTVLRKETDSLRPKLATLDTLQPKVDRLTTELSRREEEFKQLQMINADLEANLIQSRMTLSALEARSSFDAHPNGRTSSSSGNNNAIADHSMTTPKKTPKKAFLMSPDQTVTVEKPSLEFEDDGGCSWVAEAQALLGRMNDTRMDNYRAQTQAVANLTAFLNIAKQRKAATKSQSSSLMNNHYTLSPAFGLSNNLVASNPSSSNSSPAPSPLTLNMPTNLNRPLKGYDRYSDSSS